jgi:hypothetical protein
MNWYKIAITKKEFYEFYALQGLDNNVLEDNPDFLFDLIEKINYIQAYYCKYLIQGIASELGYGSKNEKIISGENEYNCTQIKDYLLIFLDKFNGKNMSKNLNIISELNKFLKLAKKSFQEIYFNRYYGGKAWAEITKWTIKLLNFKPITYKNLNFNNLRELVMTIDIINSLEHNTNFVLTRLPDKERTWLSAALEIVKSAQNPVVLSDLSGNSKLSELYRREVLPLNNTREITPEWMSIYNDLMASKLLSNKDFQELHKKRVNYIVNTNNLSFLEAVIGSHLQDHLRDIVYNPSIYTSDRIFQKLIDTAEKQELSDELDGTIYGLSFLFYSGQENVLENINFCNTAFNYLITRNYDFDFLTGLSRNKYLSSDQANKIFDVSLKFSEKIKKYSHSIYPNILNKLSPERKILALQYLEE